MLLRLRCARALALGALVCLATPALAANPAWPDPDPELTPEQLKNPATWPDDPDYGGMWNYWSFIPDSVAAIPGFRPEELALGSGMSIDRAWLLSPGDFRVTVAILDSGFRWDNRDLVNKWRLNRGELPRPQAADGTAAADHDANGDGLFNVQDYTSATGHGQPDAATITDPRLTDWNGNGILDPQDLIHAFSDGSDADGNGYVDDICGWDFLWNDNDPEDDVGNGGQGYSHGNGMARDSVGEGNNGIGGIGVCPGCSGLPLRVGDSFIADGNAFALATTYAVDLGAKVVQEALGTINNSSLAQAAIDYAYDRGVVIVASAADEASFHHNYPGNLERTLYVHAIVHDSAAWQDATTYLNFANCTNFGGHLVMSTSGTACSSEATSRSGGHAGMIQSMALKKGLTLTTGEVLQLFWMAADDIDVAESATDSTKYPSGPGWDFHFGYGRNNVWRSLKLVDDGKIPPEMDLTSPRWFETVSPGGMLEITGYVAAARAGSFDYVLEVAPGADPRDADYTAVATEDDLTARKDGLLGSVDTAAILADTSSAPLEDPHQFAVTVRLRAVAHYGGAIGDVPGTFRKSFFIHRDPALHASFPIWLGAGGESSPRLADLDGDHRDEIVVATADGRVHVFGADGAEWPGFPVTLGDIPQLVSHGAAPAFQPGGVGSDWYESTVGAASVGDVDGDGRPEIVVATLEGRVHVIGTDGAVKRTHALDRSLTDCTWGIEPANPAGCRTTGYRRVQTGATEDIWEARLLHLGFFSAPVLADWTGDGALDIAQVGMDGVLYLWDGATGGDVPGFPVRVHDPRPTRSGNRDGKQVKLSSRTESVSTPAVGDLDGDGKPELLLGTNEIYGDANSKGRVYLIKGTGGTGIEDPESSWWPGWPIESRGLILDTLPLVGRGTPGNPVMADMDGDGKLDLGVHAVAAQPNFYRYDDFDTTNERIDRRTDSAFYGTGDNSTGGELASSQDLPSWIPVNSGSVADLDGDGYLDYVDGTLGASVIFGIGGGQRGTFDHQVAAWEIGRSMANTDLSREKFVAPMLPGFPQKVDDFMFFMNYAVGDVDGDGRPEVISGTGGYRLTAFNSSGEQPAGWPKHTGNWIVATSALGDLDGDGFLDVVVNTREGWLFAWRTTGSAKSIQWEGFHHDAKATGNYHTPLAARLGPEDLLTGGTGGAAGGGDSGGCCSSAGRGSGTAGLLALLLGLVALAPGRRRRS